MCDTSLELIKTRTLFMKANEEQTVVLTDDNESMYFKFILTYTDEERGSVSFSVQDDFNATCLISIVRDSYSRWPKPLEVGTYNKTHKLFADVIVESSPALGDDHRVTVNFYQSK